MKKWNWTVGFLTFAVCVLGSMSNSTYPNMLTGFLVGLGIGIVLGLITAYIFQ